MWKFLCCLMLLFGSTAFGSPFLVSDPVAQAIGISYEILETSSAYPNGRLVYTGNTEDDGSIRLDLNEVPIGGHAWKIRYHNIEDVGISTPCQLTVANLYYTSNVKTFGYYSVNKSWVLKVFK